VRDKDITGVLDDPPYHPDNAIIVRNAAAQTDDINSGLCSGTQRGIGNAACERILGCVGKFCS
jgi:hypothetical protein